MKIILSGYMIVYTAETSKSKKENQDKKAKKKKKKNEAFSVHCFDSPKKEYITHVLDENSMYDMMFIHIHGYSVEPRWEAVLCALTRAI